MLYYLHFVFLHERGLLEDIKRAVDDYRRHRCDSIVDYDTRVDILAVLPWKPGAEWNIGAIGMSGPATFKVEV
jgi:hypothetical protein